MLQCDNLYSKNKDAPSENKCHSSFVIENEKGLHTRPSTELVKCASKFSSTIYLSFEEITVNAKSILGILMLAASKGTELKISAEGEDAQEATDAILRLAKSKFYMSY